MAYELVWTAEAEDELKAIVLYLKENWSIQSVNKFLSSTFSRLEKLVAMPSVAHPTSQQSGYMHKFSL